MSTSSATTNAVDYVFAYFSDNSDESTYTAGPGFGDTEASEDAELGGDSAFSEDEVVTRDGNSDGDGDGKSMHDTYVNVIVALETSGTPLAATPVFSPSGGSLLSRPSR